MREKMTNYIRAGFPAVALRTVEEHRALAEIAEIAKAMHRNMFVWTCTTGICQIWPGKDATDIKKYSGFKIKMDRDSNAVPETEPLGDAAVTINRETAKQKDQAGNYLSMGIMVFCDVHTFVEHMDPACERALKDLLAVASKRGIFVVFLGAEWRIPRSFENSVTVMDFDLPDRDDLDGVLGFVEKSAKLNKIKLDALTNGEREDVLRASTGLTHVEAENAFALAIQERKENKINAKTVYREKAAAVRRSGLMEIVEPDPRGMGAVGGYDNLKAWIKQYTRAFSKKAREYCLPAPRGILVVGMPGCGKSLMAKIVAGLLNVPGLRLDLASMFAGIVGESEARIRAALALADAIAPCVVWVDEIDKALAGSTSSGDLDSGVGKRILGTMLTWQAEHKHDVYMFATANQVEHLPPELLRAGRFDAIFALDLPHYDEREDIFNIHLAKRNRDPEKFDIERLAGASVDFTGSEIEEAVITGMYAAFNQDREVVTDDIVNACTKVIPLVETMPEQVDRIREWGKKRARPASSKEHTEGDRFRQMTKGVESDLSS